MKINSIIPVTILLCSFSIVAPQWGFWVCAETPFVQSVLNEQEDRKAVLFIMNYISLEDFLNMPFLKNLMSESAIGIMNVRGAAKTDSVRAYASLGWGARADALNEQCTVMAEEGYFIIPCMNQLVDMNKKNTYNPEVGLLGNFFHDMGLRTSVIGIINESEEQAMPAALIAADKFGKIDGGFLEQSVSKSNYNLVEAFRKEYENSSFIVIDAGVPAIYNSLNYSERTHNSLRNHLLLQYDKLVKDITETINKENTLLIILSPFYNSLASKSGHKLTPVVFYGKGIEPGLVISDTTRRKGLIANIDIAPSIIHFFNGNAYRVTGQPVKYKKSINNIEQLLKLDRIIAFNANNRSFILKTFISVQIALLLLSLMFILYRGNRLYRMNDILQTIVLMVLVFPAALLVVPLLHIFNTVLYILFLLLIDVGVVLIINKFIRNRSQKIIFISWLTFALLIIDILCNQSLNKISILGYDAVIGARYYGIGNEYMGVLVAAVLLGTVPPAFAKEMPGWLSAIIYVFITGIIGLPFLGANVGGTITAVCSFAFALMLIYNKKISLKNVLAILASIVLVVGGIACYDIYFSGSPSHLAKAIQAYSVNGMSSIMNIIKRKIEMNIKLFRVTIWSKVLMVSVAVVIILFLKPHGLLKRLLLQYPEFTLAWFCILVASIVGTLVNDSGVVVAATANIFLAFSLLYLLLGEKKVGIQETGEDRD